MRKLIIGLILSLVVFSSALEAKVTQSIDRQEISAGETFVLDIQIDRNIDEQPDLSLIPADFTIVSSSQYQHTQIVNGNHSSVKGWKIKLKTLKTGKITIPAISVGNEATKPITLDIKDASNQLDLNGNDKAIYLEANVDTENAYVQQQIIYTISLYRAVQTHYASLSEPQAENAIIEKLGDDIQFEKNIGNRRYIVTQRKYAIFPQQSGTLSVSPVTFTADVNDNNRRRSLFLNSTRPVSISTKPIALKIKPKPVNASEPWLPAKNVSLADRWTPAGKQLTVGEPITWTLLLSVQGLSESQLPEIQLPRIDGLQLYPDTPQKERKVDEKGILGQRIEKYAVIPSREGEVTIPEIKLSWWDTTTDSLKTAVLPAKTFKVEPGTAVASTPAALPKPVETAKVIDGIDPKTLQNWQILASGLFLLWLITLIAYIKKKGQPVVQTVRRSNETNFVQKTPTQKEALAKAKSAAKSQDWKALESSLIDLAKASGMQKINSLGALKSALSTSTDIEQIKLLESAIYSSSPESANPSISASTIDAISEQLFSSRKNEASNGIPPLYAR